MLLLPSLAPALRAAEKSTSIPEEIEWTWEVRPPHSDPQLPNVLLLGDSITRNYFPEVARKLSGIANVYLLSSSTSVGDPRLDHQIAEFAAMENMRFRVVHFNNGMHGWSYTEAQYKSQFPSFLRAVRAIVDAKGTLIWASTTPVRKDASSGATNSRIQERNRIALSFVQPAHVSVDDQFALMQQHQDLHSDDVHFNAEGFTIEGDQAATLILQALKARSN